MRISDWSSDVCSSDLPQHYAIGLKELWEVDPSRHELGLVVHGAGWPLSITGTDSTGGSFLYHLENNQVVVGLIVDLSYTNPYLSPFDDFQRFKHHPVIAKYLEGGKRLRSEEHTSELQSLMRISYAVFCLKKKNI